MGVGEFGRPRVPWEHEIVGSNPTTHTSYNEREGIKIELLRLFFFLVVLISPLILVYMVFKKT